MSSVHDYEDDRFGADAPGRSGRDATRGAFADTQIAVGTDERRMHVRAYNHWVSLLGGRSYPSIQDLDPATIADFGANSVLLDFSKGTANPAIAYLGRALREECSLDGGTTHIAHVPSGSLLSRLTDHYLQIIANRSPIGFEAEFVSTRGHNTLYRGILMPFSSDADTIDFIYGVINWKELVDADTEARLYAEIEAARTVQPRTATAPVWADGPSHTLATLIDSTAHRANADNPDQEGLDQDGDDHPDEHDTAEGTDHDASLPDRLLLAQQTAAAVATADLRSRATLYRALGRAHDFAIAADADPRGYEALLEQANIAVQLRAPMTPVVKLVFGIGYDKTRLAEYAAVLAHARRAGVQAGDLQDFLDRFDGGIKGIVQSERLARAPFAGARSDSCATLAERPSLARIALDTGASEGDYVLLLARSAPSGTLDIVATVTDDAALTQRVMRQAAR
jgi:hypothetical protein